MLCRGVMGGEYMGVIIHGLHILYIAACCIRSIGGRNINYSYPVLVEVGAGSTSGVSR